MKKLYYRFGDIPEDGYSSIWRIDELIGKEKGFQFTRHTRILMVLMYL